MPIMFANGAASRSTTDGVVGAIGLRALPPDREFGLTVRGRESLLFPNQLLIYRNNTTLSGYVNSIAMLDRINIGRNNKNLCI